MCLTVAQWQALTTFLGVSQPNLITFLFSKNVQWLETSSRIIAVRAQKWRHLSDLVELFFFAPPIGFCRTIFFTFCPTLPTPSVTSGRWVTRAACVNYPACSTSVITPTQPTVRGCPNPNPRVVGPPGLRGPLGYVGPSGLPMLPHRLC